jgi:hypothetical protein
VVELLVKSIIVVDESILIMVIVVEVVIVVTPVTEIVIIVPSDYVIIVVPSDFYNTVDPSSFVINNPSSVISELTATILCNEDIVEDTEEIELVAASNPKLGKEASKSANIFAAISAAVSGLLAASYSATFSAYSLYSSSVPHVKGQGVSSPLSSVHFL